MGSSATGYVSYGIVIEEPTELPWVDLDNDESDLDEWWKKVKGYAPPFEMFTETGEWIGGKQWPEDKCEEYYGAERKFFKANPVPVEEVHTNFNFDGPIVLAVPGTVQRGDQWSPSVLDLGKLQVDGDAWKRYHDFLETYLKEQPGKADWILSACYG